MSNGSGSWSGNWWEFHPSTSAHVDIVAANNATMLDAFQFSQPTAPTGITGGTGPYWTMVGMNFRLDVKGNHEQVAPLVSFTSGAGQIVVDSTTLNVLHFNVPESVIAAALPPGCYFYDFIMYDASTPNIRIPLMHGKFTVVDGWTGG